MIHLDLTTGEWVPVIIVGDPTDNYLAGLLTHIEAQTGPIRRAVLLVQVGQRITATDLGSGEVATAMI